MTTKDAVPLTNDLPPLPAPFEIDWPELHSQALGCGVEDRNLTNRYECAEYGWQEGVDRAADRVPEEIFTADQMLEYARQAVAAALAPPAVQAAQAEGVQSHISETILSVIVKKARSGGNYAEGYGRAHLFLAEAGMIAAPAASAGEQA